MGTPTPEKPLDTTLRMRAIPARSARPAPSALRYAAMKTPEVTVLFWVVKLLTTAMGESTSDYLVYHIDPYLAVGLGALGLVVALVLQLFVRRYIAWVYWLAVLMVAIFGTMAADVLHIVLHVSYLHSSLFFASALAIIFVSWYATEKTLSIHSIYTPRRELFYWATVMATFALGTALGDLMAVTASLGYLGAGILFAALFALPALAYWLLGLDEIAAFWCAYIVTRPLGASFADWFGKPTYITGLGFGDGPVSLVLAILIVGFVAYLSVTRIDVQKATN
ncbi:MAG TPA: hypothetical protein VF739_15450 [Ktedonobacterales bacterium]